MAIWRIGIKYSSSFLIASLIPVLKSVQSSCHSGEVITTTKTFYFKETPFSFVFPHKHKLCIFYPFVQNSSIITFCRPSMPQATCRRSMLSRLQVFGEKNNGLCQNSSKHLRQHWHHYEGSHNTNTWFGIRPILSFNLQQNAPACLSKSFN